MIAVAGLAAELHDGWEAPVFIGFVAADHKCVAGVCFGWMNDAQRPKRKDVDLGVRRMVMKRVLWAFALATRDSSCVLILQQDQQDFFLLGAAWVPKGPGRFALQSAKRLRNGRNRINKNIKQYTFKGHSN